MSTARRTAKTAENIRDRAPVRREYFDGPRDYGYGGYRYDGRWVPVAEDMVAALRARSRATACSTSAAPRASWSRIS